jgi:tetratricopeptide (TPR) repeat protein
MTQERFENIEFLYQAALDRAPEARSSFLVEACSGDAELQREVESLLGQTGSIFNRPAWDLEAGLIDDLIPPALSRGTHLGPYRIEELLGVGGMGEVFLARDTRLKRTVAIKVLTRAGVPDPELKRRFLREARAASALNHPNIVTVHDIASANAIDYLVMEYVPGKPLDKLITRQGLPLEHVVRYGLQITGALAAAHAAGIVHRDIKPANVIVTADGQIKVLDFGLAKPEENARHANHRAQITGPSTQAGMMVGTVSYMSPEQIRGEPVDGRSDLWSLGVLLYEAATGARPFEGTTQGMILEGVLARPPVPMRERSSRSSPELETMVARLLQKDLNKRYQTADELLVDLRKLQTPAAVRRPVRAYKAAIFAAALVMIVAAVLVWQHRPTRPLTDKDVLVLAEFTNTSGDSIFDGTLREALAIQLEQSPFLKVLSDDAVRADLRLMGRSQTERITSDIAREICQRENEKATIGGTVSSLGKAYAVTLESVNCRTGDTLAREQAVAPIKEDVLGAVEKAARGMRRKLGESLSSIQTLQAPSDRVTTASLPALQLFAQGVILFRRGAFLDAIPVFQRATELDPDFAAGWNYLGISYHGAGENGPQMSSNLTRAFALRDRVTEYERLTIATQYYLFVTREWNKAAQSAELWARTYPRDYIAHHNSGLARFDLGEIEEALGKSLEAYRIEPRNTFVHGVLVDRLIALDRFDEARRIAETELLHNADEARLHVQLLRVALIQGDSTAAERQNRWFAGNPDEYRGLLADATAAKVLGRFRQANELVRKANELRRQRSLPPSPASSAEDQALLGNCAATRREGSAEAVALTLCGDAAQTAVALKRSEDASVQSPDNTLLNAIELPMLRAAAQLQRDQPSKAIDLLQPIIPYERTRPEVVYLRALSYIRAGKGAQAQAEFQKIVDHKGANWGPFYPVSYVGLARAAALAGDSSGARKAYEQFLSLWKDADPGIPILIEARKEYASLH